MGSCQSQDIGYDDVDLKDSVAFVPPIEAGKVVKVYDGDTFTIITRLASNPTLYKFQIRMNGIDAPEIKTKVDHEKQLALHSRDELSNLIFHKVVVLKNLSYEKYGRILADVYCNGIHVNEWMLHKSLAVRYDGGKKSRPKEWDVDDF